MRDAPTAKRAGHAFERGRNILERGALIAVPPLQLHGDMRQAFAKFGFLGVLDRGMRELWLRLGMGTLHRLRVSRKNGYGWREAILFPAPDYWLRYQAALEAVRKQIRMDRPFRLLEVGSGSAGITWFLRDASIRMCLADQTPQVLKARATATAWRVCTDALVLPFRDNEFDVVVSLDTLEHIPQNQRQRFAEELKRVSRVGVVLSCPADSADGRFQASRFDRLLWDSVRARAKAVPGWLEDHLDKGHPEVAELMNIFPKAQLHGLVDCGAWLRSTSVYLRPFGWIAAGLIYLLHLRKHGTSTAQYRIALVWSKRSGSEETPWV